MAEAKTGKTKRKRSNVYLKKDCNVLLGGLGESLGAFSTGEATGMGRRHTGGSVFGVGM